MKWILLLTLVSSCSNAQIINKKIESDSNKVIQDFEYKAKNIEVFNGKVKFVEFAVDLQDGTHVIKCSEQGSKKPLNQSLSISVNNRNAILYYAESYFSMAKKHHCFVGKNKVLDITVKQYPYKQEQLKVAKGKVKLSKANQKRAAREWHMTQKVYKNALDTLLIDKPFELPLNSYITSRYGKRRIFNNMKKSQHLGNDFRAKVGVPIPVANRGKVVFAGDLFYTGNVVIVDHGMKIFTLYAHLSKITSKVGSIIEQGDIVGLSGSTGRVSGPHLHWGVKMNGYNIDGFSLVEESKNHFVKNELAK
ncbi:MAG: murein DD-endopeptidase MepM/ murein hydrolase activator NlpD [Bacteriovoracaceae bacterium]|jgi:murein DD-endopeptidase MepM/ murein hydrolase activator NlpD